MAIKDIPLELIDDNPYNPRKHYPRDKVDELAKSIKMHGLLELPKARPKDGRYQLAFGSMRKRAYEKLAKEDSEKWRAMPLELVEITDDEIFYYAIEENLKRTDLSPIEIARGIDAFLEKAEITEEKLAKALNMTQGNISNMRRVLQLPEQILEKIDSGLLNFTMGRELLVFNVLENAKELMLQAVGNLKTGNKSYGEPVTVEGMQKAIHSVARQNFKALERGIAWYGRDPDFDTRAVGCLKCDKMVLTHPTKSQANHWCTNAECWQKKQQEHSDKMAAEAKARMEADVLKRAASSISQEIPEPAYTLEKRGSSWVALDDQGVIIAIAQDKESADAKATASFESVATKINPSSDEYLLNHTYRIIHKNHVENVPDVTAQDLATAIRAVGVSPENVGSTKVWKSSGKLGTGGWVSAGWCKCTESLDKLAKVEEQMEHDLETAVDERDRKLEEAREKANLERPAGELPCDTCLKGQTCDRSRFYIADDDSGRYVCDLWECDHVSWAVKKEVSVEVPTDLLSLAKEKAGTRAEVLDLKDITTGNEYNRQYKAGYTVIKGEYKDELRYMDEPEECTEHCTQGFHYAFDSSARAQRDQEGTPVVLYICSNQKCLSQKKATFTRKKNAEGQARKKAEVSAVKKAVNDTFSITRSHIKVILLAQIKGIHIAKSYSGYGGEKFKEPLKWLWDKVSAGTKESDRTNEKLFKAIDKLTDEDLASLVIEVMFYYLMDHGDIGTYEIKTEVPLGWLGVKIELEEEKEPAGVEKE